MKLVHAVVAASSAGALLQRHATVARGAVLQGGEAQCAVVVHSLKARVPLPPRRELSHTGCAGDP